MGFVILPSTKRVLPKSPETKQFMKTIQHRMRSLIYISMVMLFLTGVLLARYSGLYLGFISLGNEYSILTTIKHVLYVSMILVMLTRSQILKKLNLNSKKEERLSVLLLFLNILLATLVLFLSAILVGVAVSS